MMRGCFLRPLLQPACGLIATTMSADSSSPSPAPASVDAAATGAGRARRGGKRQRPRNPAPAATTPDAAPGVAKAPRTPHPVLEQLAGLYPHLFGAVFRPLKRGIFQDLLAAHPDAFEREALKVALGIHTRSTRYLQAVAAGEKRHDLQGQPVEAMAPEHVHHALLEVYRRRKNQKGRPTEDLLPKLRNRIIAAFESSGLTPPATPRPKPCCAPLKPAAARWSSLPICTAWIRAAPASNSNARANWPLPPRATHPPAPRRCNHATALPCC